MKYVFFDAETTGLNPFYHEILTLAVVFEDDINNHLDHRVFRIRPKYPKRIDKEAEKTHGITREKWKLFDSPEKVHEDLCLFLSGYIDKFNPADKAVPVAYNIPFDMAFLSEFFNRCEDPYLGSYINRSMMLDPLSMIRTLRFLELIPRLQNHKLSTVCQHFGISITAHDVYSDTLAVREVFYKCVDIMKGRI